MFGRLKNFYYLYIRKREGNEEKKTSKKVSIKLAQLKNFPYLYIIIKRETKKQKVSRETITT